jgi:glycerol-3-phosphate dehydrogenase
MVRAYGTRMHRIFGTADNLDAVGPSFTHGLTGAEIRYLMRSEWAESAADVLWRRTKLGLHLSAEEQAAVGRFMANESGRKAAG